MKGERSDRQPHARSRSEGIFCTYIKKKGVKCARMTDNCDSRSARKSMIVLSFKYRSRERISRWDDEKREWVYIHVRLYICIHRCLYIHVQMHVHTFLFKFYVATQKREKERESVCERERDDDDEPSDSRLHV